MRVFGIILTRRILIAGLMLIAGWGLAGWWFLQQPRCVAEVTLVRVKPSQLGGYVVRVLINQRPSTVGEVIRRSPNGRVESLMGHEVGNAVFIGRPSLYSRLYELARPIDRINPCEGTFRLPADDGEAVKLHVPVGTVCRVSDSEELTLISSSVSGAQVRSISVQVNEVEPLQLRFK